MSQKSLHQICSIKAPCCWAAALGFGACFGLMHLDGQVEFQHVPRGWPRQQVKGLLSPALSSSGGEGEEQQRKQRRWADVVPWLDLPGPRWGTSFCERSGD